jgi:hypothetical protein
LKPFFSGLILLLSLASAHAAEGEWPRSVGAKNSSECRAALNLARTAFHSTDFTPSAAYSMPRHFGYKRVSGERAAAPRVLADPDVFTKSPLPANMNHRSLYWQTRAGQDQRLVIEEVWAPIHATYELFAIDVAMDKATYLARRQDEFGKNALSSLFYSVINVPAVFQKSGSTELWAMNEGYLNDFLPNWTVYTTSHHRYQETCKIRFRPQGKDASHLLPPPAQLLATLLERVVAPINLVRSGSPPDVFYSVIGQTWANAALRPWAVTHRPLVARRHSEKNLKKWMVSDRATRKAYLAARVQLPLAELALIEHYKTTFNMSESKATVAARTWIDSAYQSYAIFLELRPLYGDSSMNGLPKRLAAMTGMQSREHD